MIMNNSAERKAANSSCNLPLLIPLIHSVDDIDIPGVEPSEDRSEFEKIERLKKNIRAEERFTSLFSGLMSNDQALAGPFMNSKCTRFGISNDIQSASSPRISHTIHKTGDNLFQDITILPELGISRSASLFSSPSLDSLASLTVNCCKNNASEFHSMYSLSDRKVSPAEIKSSSNSDLNVWKPETQLNQVNIKKLSNSMKERSNLLCTMCTFSGNSTEEMNNHLEIVHSTFSCFVCNFSSRSQARLSRHLAENHDGVLEHQKKEMKKSKRLRKYSCKQCPFSTSVQEEIWLHTRVHVPASKLLSCPRCPFVCAFKHHMQYHLNNHFGYKPYKCHLCNYRCNNKSMLNSHLKSHSNEYPFKCSKCSYATKYRQALYIHSSKANHAFEEQDRGNDDEMKWNQHFKNQHSELSEEETKELIGIPSENSSPLNEARSPPRSVRNGIDIFQINQEHGEGSNGKEKQTDLESIVNHRHHFDLKGQMLHSFPTYGLPHERFNTWYPGKFKLMLNKETEDDETSLSSPLDLSVNKSSPEKRSEQKDAVKRCDFCSIIFEDSSLFLCHMTCHDPEIPFKCNLCGKRTRNKVEFFLHLCEIGHHAGVFEKFLSCRDSTT